MVGSRQYLQKKSNFWDQEIDVPVRTRKAHFMGAGLEANKPEV